MASEWLFQLLAVSAYLAGLRLPQVRCVASGRPRWPLSGLLDAAGGLLGASERGERATFDTLGLQLPSLRASVRALVIADLPPRIM